MKNEALTFNMVQEMKGKEKIQNKKKNKQTNKQLTSHVFGFF